ncbi:MAG: hypothetical protein AAGB18_06495 [Pseudomonadota bacterium]
MGKAKLVERQKRHFSDRIKRIESGGPNTSGTIYAGIDEQVTRKKKRRRRTDGTPISFQLFMILFGLAMGAVIMFIGRMGAYHALAEPDFISPENLTTFRLTGDIGIAVGLSMIAVPLFSLGRGMRLVAFMLGFIAVMLGEASLIAQAPEAFAGMFSEDYVAEAVAAAPENPFTPEAFGL